MQDFELMVIIDQEVTQLEVTGNDVRGVNVLETAKGLMNKRPEMSVGEWLLGADLCREHSVAQLADAERGASFAMVCRSASINSDSWKVRVSLYQTETRVGVREGNARINKPRQDFNLVRKPDPCRRDAPRIWAPLNGLETFPMYILLATEVVQQPVVKRAYDEGEYGRSGRKTYLRHRLVRTNAIDLFNCHPGFTLDAMVTDSRSCWLQCLF